MDTSHSRGYHFKTSRVDTFKVELLIDLLQICKGIFEKVEARISSQIIFIISSSIACFSHINQGYFLMIYPVPRAQSDIFPMVVLREKQQIFTFQTLKPANV